MSLLRFSAANHKSIRDRMELDLVSSRLKSQRPTDGDWASVTLPVAAIFGANASGKSTLLDALLYAQSAVRMSASGWLDAKTLPHAPFRLDDAHRNAPSSYGFDLVVDGVRTEYGFEIHSSGVIGEWLVDYPSGRRRMLFRRGAAETAGIDFGRGFARPAAIAAATSGRELLLSRGHQLGHPQLTKVWRVIAEEVEFATLSEWDRSRRIQSIVDAIQAGTTTFDEIITLLRIADIGIESVSIREEEVPESLQQLVAALNESLSPTDFDAGPILSPLAVAEVVHQLEFTHRGQASTSRGLALGDESAGTISWLSLAVPAMDALRAGSVLCIDEIDASLHSQLSALLVAAFQDPSLNTRGAQLVFTSHDTYLLAPQSDLGLATEQVWLTEKGIDGATELFSVSDFAGRPSDNLAKRYVAGRYGGLPRLAPSLFAGLLTEHPAS